jgi:hypothetical protein
MCEVVVMLANQHAEQVVPGFSLRPDHESGHLLVQLPGDAYEVFATNAAGLEGAMGRGDVGERVHGVDHGPQRPVLDVAGQLGEQRGGGVAAEEPDAPATPSADAATSTAERAERTVMATMRPRGASSRR